MERLIAFGCSFTFGHGLSDCFRPPVDPGRRPSNKVWPNLIATHLKRKCINKSWPGSSNKRIWKSILDFKFKKDDIVFILWSFPERTAIFKETNKTVDIITSNSNNELYYKNFYDEYDSKTMMGLFISHANFYLESKNIKTFNLLVRKEYRDNLIKDQSINLVPYFLGDMMHDYPLALDNSHPGEEFQKVFSNKVITHIDEPISNNQTTFEKIKKVFRNES